MLALHRLGPIFGSPAPVPAALKASNVASQTLHPCGFHVLVDAGVIRNAMAAQGKVVL
jgi:hypothetical protein